MIVGLSSISSSYNEFEELCDTVKGYGFNALEIVGNDPRVRILFPDELGNKLKVAVDNGIHIQYHQALFQHSDGYIYPSDDFCRLSIEEGTMRLGVMLRLADKICAENVIIHMGSMEKDGNRTGTMNTFAGIVRNVLPQLEKTGINLCVENMYQYEDYTGYPVLGMEPVEFLRFFEMVDNPRIRLNLDVGHANVMHNLEEFLETLCDKIAYVHLADNFGKRDEHLGMGMGSINWNEVIGKLVNRGFDGPYILEYPDKYLRDTLDNVRKILNERNR